MIEQVNPVAAVLIAAATVTPSTILAWKASKSSASADNAVNHRKPEEPRLVEMVEAIHATVNHPESGLPGLSKKIDAHLAWHQGERQMEHKDAN